MHPICNQGTLEHFMIEIYRCFCCCFTVHIIWQFVTGFALNVFNIIIIRTATTILSADSSICSYRASANLQWFMLLCVAGTTVIIVTPTSLMIR